VYPPKKQSPQHNERLDLRRCEQLGNNNAHTLGSMRGDADVLAGERVTEIHFLSLETNPAAVRDGMVVALQQIWFARSEHLEPLFSRADHVIV
jgi:hypothetical protein